MKVMKIIWSILIGLTVVILLVGLGGCIEILTATAQSIEGQPIQSGSVVWVSGLPDSGVIAVTYEARGENANIPMVNITFSGRDESIYQSIMLDGMPEALVVVGCGRVVSIINQVKNVDGPNTGEDITDVYIDKVEIPDMISSIPCNPLNSVYIPFTGKE
jgi:hypothetical protein